MCNIDGPGVWDKLNLSQLHTLSIHYSSDTLELLEKLAKNDLFSGL